ncbi:Sds3-like-domain-containing protein [Gongronella butleri]|nr:Sds3-like-domain-containing protein [Gongronella butleri]
MPLASMLETNKPFMFSNGTSSDGKKAKLGSPSQTERYSYPSSDYEPSRHGYHIAYTQDSLLASSPATSGAPSASSPHLPHRYTTNDPITLPPPSALTKVKLEDASPRQQNAQVIPPPAVSSSSSSSATSIASIVAPHHPPPPPPQATTAPVPSPPPQQAHHQLLHHHQQQHQHQTHPSQHQLHQHPLHHAKKQTHHQQQPHHDLHDQGVLPPGYYDTSAADSRRLKRRRELNQRIEYLNNDFLQSKERLFAEKLMMIQTEIDQALNNTHAQYQESLVLLDSIRQKSIQDGRMFRDYQTSVTDKQFTLEIHQAEEEYMVEKHEVREKLFAALEDKRRKLKEDKDNCDLTFDVLMETQTRSNKRSLRKRGMETADGKSSNSKRKQATGPTLMFRLKDDELLDDLQAMRSGLASASAPAKKSSSTASSFSKKK